MDTTVNVLNLNNAYGVHLDKYCIYLVKLCGFITFIPKIDDAATFPIRTPLIAHIGVSNLFLQSIVGLFMCSDYCRCNV